jgi:carboxyl-terminal processing protease
MKRAWLALLLAIPAWGGQPSSVTVTYTLEEIHDRALRPVTEEVLAMEGLTGLSTIDPSFEVTRGDGKRIELHYGNQVLASYFAPHADDPLGWGMIIDRAAHQAAKKSPAIAHADNDQLTQAIIDSMLTKLDVFSHYAGPAEARERHASRSGFGGIGVRFDLGDTGITLTEVMPESPALQAKLKVGDLITAIDGEPVVQLDQSAISQKLRGPIASAVKLTLQRPEQPAAVLTLRRSLIVPPTVVSQIEGGIGVIAVSGFNDNTGAGVAEAVRKAKNSANFKGIVLDLRGNPGGLLDQGVAVADIFIAQGRILATRGRHPDALQTYDAKGGDVGENVPLVVLVDGRTASAAEIAAAALQDSGRAVIVGTNSFGKGTVQTVLPLPNQGELTLTWSRFFVPSGYALHGLGVLPAICTAGGAPAGDKMLADGRAAPPALFAAWRSAPPDDANRRSKLRGHCLAEDHARNELDLAIAKRLLNDPALYARALAVAAPVATASTQHNPASLNRD